MQDKLVVALYRDQRFGASLSDWVRWVGYGYMQAATRADLLDMLRATSPALVVVDLSNGPGDLDEIARLAGEARLVAFGPPREFESFPATEAAGFHEVLPAMVFHRGVPDVLTRSLGVELPVRPPRWERGRTVGGPLRTLWRRLGGGEGRRSSASDRDR